MNILMRKIEGGEERERKERGAEAKKEEGKPEAEREPQHSRSNTKRNLFILIIILDKESRIRDGKE